MEETECSETSGYNIETPGNCPEESIQHLELGESLKSRMLLLITFVVQNLLSSRLLSKNLKIKIYRTVILPVVLYGCETLSLILRGERKLRVSESMVLR